MGRSVERRGLLNKRVGGAATRCPYSGEKSGGVFILLLELNGQPQPLPGEGSKFTDLYDVCLLRDLERPVGGGPGGEFHSVSDMDAPP
jgi:hypothetical protein